MTNHFQRSLLVASIGTLSAGLLMSAPAYAECANNAGYAECIKQQTKIENSIIKGNNQQTGEINKSIVETRNNMNARDFAGGLTNLAFSLRPGLMYGNDGIGYGAQTRFQMSREADLRMGLYFQPEVTTWDFAATYKFGERGEIQPFIGGGFQSKSFGSKYTGNRDRGPGVSLLAGVDVPLANASRVSAQVNLPVASIVSLLPEMDSPSSSIELQVMVTLFDF